MPAAIGQPTSHVTTYQPVRLWVGQIVGGRRTRAQPHWAPVQGPSTPTGSPWGSDLPDQGQASDTNELSSPYCWHYFQDCLQFVSMSPIIYSCTKCMEMLYGLFSLQTNDAYPSTINLMYYYTKVLLLRNNFSNNTLEMLW